MDLNIYQVDAFTDRIFSGNPAAVIPLDHWLPDEKLQAIALENNLSETAYFKPNALGYDLRWFTPVIEVDLCGHATLASGHVLYAHLGYTGDQIIFYSRSGPLTVSRKEDTYTMDFPADTLIRVPDPPEPLLAGLRVRPVAVLKGREDYLVILSSEEEVAGLQPDFRALSQLAGRGVIASAPGKTADFVSRCFFPNAGIDEDPVTGSAHTSLMPYWADKLGKKELYARQISARGGELLCRLKNERVEIAGKAVTYMLGKVIMEGA